MPRKKTNAKKLRASRTAGGIFSFWRPRREKYPRTVPTRFVKFFIGILLLPIAGILTQTFFTCFQQATIHHGFWKTIEFRFFAVGAAGWTLAFLVLPRPLWIYVFGHELTHAIWVWLMGGRVSKFKVGSDGGHIITDTHNFWIALAPYFFPIYSALVLLAWGGASLFYELAPHRAWLYAFIGATWAFHVTFTLWMIPKGQSDLTYHGTFFSLVVIYAMNLFLLSMLLIAAASQVTWRDFARELFENTLTFSAWARGWIESLLGS